MRVILKEITYFYIVFSIFWIAGLNLSAALTHDPSAQATQLSASYALPSNNLDFSNLVDCLKYFDPSSERHHRTKSGGFFTGYEQIFTMHLNESLMLNSYTLEPYRSPSVLAYLHGRPKLNEDFNRFVIITSTTHQCVQVPKTDFNDEIDGTYFGIHRILDLGNIFDSGVDAPSYVLSYRSIGPGNRLSLPMLTSDEPTQFVVNFSNTILSDSEGLYLRPNPQDHLCDISESDRSVQELLSLEIISQMIAYFAQEKLEQYRRVRDIQDSPNFETLVQEFSGRVNSCQGSIDSQKRLVQSSTSSHLERKNEIYELQPLLESLGESAAELDYIYRELLKFSRN